jgi:hypothetical protein
MIRTFDLLRFASSHAASTMLARVVLGALADATAVVGAMSVMIGSKSHLNRLRDLTESCCIFSPCTLLFRGFSGFQPTGQILD